MESINCPGCGNTLEAAAKFCPYCGLELIAPADATDPTVLEVTLEAEETAPEQDDQPIPIQTNTEQSLHPYKHSTERKKRGFRWQYLIGTTILIGTLIYFFNQPKSNVVNEFKDANAATGWQFTAYSTPSFVRTAGGLTLYNGIYTNRESHQDVTVTVNAAIKTDISIEQNGYLCIWLRYNPSLGKGYCFILKPVSKTVHLGIAGDPNPQSVDLNQLIPGFNPYQPHSYTASVHGESLQFAIDEKQVASLYDVGLLKGQVALEARGLGVSITKAEITP